MHTKLLLHYNDVIMSEIASHITSLTIVYSIVYSDADQRIHQSSASLAFVREIQRGPVNSPHKCPVTRKMFPFDDVIMNPEVRGPMKRLIISYCLYGWFSYLELLIFFELRVIRTIPRWEVVRKLSVTICVEIYYIKTSWFIHGGHVIMCRRS